MCSAEGGEGHGPIMGRSRQNRRDGLLGNRSTTSSGGTDGEVIDVTAVNSLVYFIFL